MSIELSSTQNTYGLLNSGNPYSACWRFFEPRGVHIDQLGEKTLKQLVEKRLIQKPLNMFFISYGALIGIDRGGLKQARKIYEGIERAKNVRLGPLLFACGIYGVEEEEAWLLAEKFNSLEALYDASVDSLLSHGFLNESVAVNAYNFFRHPANVLALTELQEKAGLKISNVKI
ncbi:DNA ligase [Klebsiella pneumoniae]|jgi:DNA ligase (NAD+)|uniref:DisA/LigA helix-hairpin-helix motif domain-containing protein n=5 Tax=Klebsiella pneumoniae TaxID=573 RepID=A0A0H3GZ78_KLEPH|nr:MULTISPECIES: helix-hairpin-helix domain-containing protein [Klebsiella]YP_005220860.1 hypothetical protein [Klebsiella pneumoniae subsp. pneumoniae HS11286]NRE85222.1 hypothetical protein [Klebsiella michiganensis]UMX52406.1 hypothetical protein MJ389_27480 [Escherichia coli]AEW91961.1 hypothetical protein KPHS_p100530 [Klebsiella pneumoniae subsp. pneumoniae HS11286]ASC26318.1 hypothetical protein AM386_31890 [Klebsiella pneumoniae]AVT92044.1 hypothetical protein CU111_29730 [Klebsiella 